MAEAAPQGKRKRITRIKPRLIAEVIGDELAAEVGRALGLPSSDLYLTEPTIIELTTLLQAKVDQFDRIPMILRMSVKDGEGKRIFPAGDEGNDLLDSQPASVFADLIHEASLFTAGRIEEIFGLEEDTSPKTQPQSSGSEESSTK